GGAAGARRRQVLRASPRSRRASARGRTGSRRNSLAPVGAPGQDPLTDRAGRAGTRIRRGDEQETG
ncbi:hypothetical protein, partial [Micromonospora sp. NPDC000018]|uniref:hypothetical protein n=1 Tax=Micromonospora sp. NPDC000018 TaxID=3154239 RepID=UPI00331C41CA